MSSQTIIGKLGRDPDLKYAESGMAVCKFSVAVSRRKKQGDDYVDATVWLDLVCFSKLAEHAAETLNKGDEIIAEGHLEEPRTYEKKDGTTGVGLPFIADNVGVSLRWQSARTRKVGYVTPEKKELTHEPF